MRSRLTYANVVATLALVFSMTGGAIAANHYLIESTTQINPKVLKKLKGHAGKPGKTGAAGTAGAPGAAGKDGAPGKEGAKGKEGAQGPGIVASGLAKGDCSLVAGDNFCFASSEAEFTASANAKCLVTAAAQADKENKPAAVGPFMRVAIRDDGTPVNDGEYGFYIPGTSTDYAASATRPALISVEAGHDYAFGAYLGFPSSEWQEAFVEFRVSYVCFA